MSNLIAERVEQARLGQNPYVIARMKSGWAVIGDVQPLTGYCLLLADPVIASINELDEPGRTQYSLDMLRIGDALFEATEAYRINYETLGNSEPALHTHIIPRYTWEPDGKRRMPAFQSYDWPSARKFDPAADGPFIARMRSLLERP